MVRYLLAGTKPVPVSWDRWRKYAGVADSTRVGRSKVGAAAVSTVFLEANLELDEREPGVFFETLIFGGQHSDWRRLSETWEEAYRIHRKVVANLKAKRHPGHRLP